MKNQWIYYFTGIVTVKATGKGLERFLNVLTRNRITIWNIKRHGIQTITFQVKLSDAFKLRHFVRGTDCKLSFLKRTGLPFQWKTLRKNSGFLIGGFLFMIVLFLLSNMIWGVEITGADPATEYKIRKELNGIGVKKGRLQFLVKDPESIQRHLTEKIDELTWIGVELKGTVYHLQAVEKIIPKKKAKPGPQHLVAKKKAIIVEMFVEEGLAQVDIYDFVSPGQILVSGEIGNEEEKKMVSARGKIYGETWYKSEVILPLKSQFEVFSGNEKRKYGIKLGDFLIPLWGFGKIPFEKYKEEKDERPLKFFKWKLPIAYCQIHFRESEKVTREYTREQGIHVAKEMARKDIMKQLEEDATIKGEKVLQQKIQDGKLYLTIHFQVVENIVEAQPIIQGETE